MQSFVANFQSPFDLDELEWNLRKGVPTNLGCIFEPAPGDPLGMWSVPKWAKVGDRVYFMCAATSTQHMAHVCKQARESERQDLIDFANRERDLYIRCAARILAVGRVAATPVPPDEGSSKALWWAPIRDFVVLHIPLEPNDWKPIFKVSRTGSITKLSVDQANALEGLVRAMNPYARIPPLSNEPMDDGRTDKVESVSPGASWSERGFSDGAPLSDEDAGKAVDMWTMGLGVMGDVGRNGSAPGQAERRALKNDWKTVPMPMERVEIELGLPLTKAEFEVLAAGHVPMAMEDHWFMYFDGDALCFHRSWTGYCIYKVHVAHAKEGDGFVLLSVTANRDRSQYSESSDDKDRVMATILVGQALSRDVDALWEEHHRMGGQDGSTVAQTSPMVVGFWKADEANGFLSNWNGVGFELFGNRYPTSEHWIMWQKARVMGDWSAADAILAAKGPKEAKALGGKVGPFDDAVWRAVREELAYVGVREKFIQNPELARALMDTGDSVLAEASPLDRVWGVGIEADDPGFANMTGWRGENLQGRICMRVRSDLRLLMPDGPSQFDVWTTDEDLEGVVPSSVGGMTLLALTRNPKTRPSALCYARICQHLSTGRFADAHAFLMSCGQATIAHIDEGVELGQSRCYTPVGWHELLAQLAFLRRVGVL